MHHTLEFKVISQQQYSVSGDHWKRLRIHSAPESA
jgi:hypothetical protein